MNILDILRKNTDKNHPISQKEILDILGSEEYNMPIDRKAVKRNLMNLIDFGFDIKYSESTRMMPGKKRGKFEENYTASDFYIEPPFTDAELRLLIDSLLFSKHLPYSHCKELIEKLEGLSNKYFKSITKHIKTMPEKTPRNKQLFATIETLDKAITQRQQVSFTYNEYGVDKKLHPRLNENGKPREYVINPYQIAATNGRYYLICNYDKYDNIAYYRLERITNIKLLDTPIKSLKMIKGFEKGIDLPKHMAEHIYMFTGESDTVTFRAKKYIISDIIDWFGTDVVFTNETKDEVTAKVKVNLQAMQYWALQYMNHVRVVSPRKLVNAIKDNILQAAKNYKI